MGKELAIVYQDGIKYAAMQNIDVAALLLVPTRRSRISIEEIMVAHGFKVLFHRADVKITNGAGLMPFSETYLRHFPFIEKYDVSVNLAKKIMNKKMRPVDLENVRFIKTGRNFQ